MLPSLPGHTWRFSTADQLRHQYPVDARPDGEGLITAACNQLAHAGRIESPGAGPEPHCPRCLTAVTAGDADRIERNQAAHARAQQDELRDGTFNV